MGEKIWKIILAVILLGVFLYVVTSGILVTGFKALNGFAAPTSSGGFFNFSLGPSSLPGYLTPIGGDSSNESGGGTAGTGGTTISGQGANSNPNLVNISPYEIPAGYTVSQLSPYFHEVRLGGVSAGTFYSYGTITLDAYLSNLSSSIDISGWQIKTKNSGEYIPQAVNIYDPSGLTPETDILVKNGDVVYMYSSSAPFNLRLNECIGYIANVANFQPSLPLSCPYVDQSQIQNLSGQCQNYIDTISSCQQPNMQTAQISQTDYACQDFLENNFTYKSCFNEHDTDSNFLSNQIWVWTGGNVINQYHDTVQLLDRNGLLVDEYSF